MPVPSATPKPSPDKDTAYYVFKQLFRVRVKEIDMMTPEQVKERGFLSSGDIERDKQAAHELRERYMPIARMAELYAKGVQVGICHRPDTKLIYEYTQAHLEAWKKVLARSLNEAKVNRQDLIDLDKFAQAIWQHARYFYPNNAKADSPLARRISGLAGLGANPLGPAPVTKPIPEAEQTPEQRSQEQLLDERYGRRESLTEYFSRSPARAPKRT